MVRYEVKLKGMDAETVILNRLCESPVKKGKDTLKVAVLDLTNGQVRLEDYKDEEQHKYLYALPTSNRAIGPAWRLYFTKRDKGSHEIIQKIKTALREIQSTLAGLANTTESLRSEGQTYLEKSQEALTNANKEIAVCLIEKLKNFSSVL
ncbi:MAG: hypothetical protein ACUVTP_11855 [Candidatus Fervidibacter sp.]|uniref:hypothetical protein n=1 Tax=Candidatus Fervidibacter sp. TaxID=3100871 RepID=UPI00404A8C04